MENNMPGWGPRPARPSARGRITLTAPRAAVLDLLAHQSAPCTVGALAEALHQHPNTVREHLDALVGGGLVERSRAAAQGRGRPAWLYRAVETTPVAGREYVGLASALAAQIARRSPDPRGEAVEAGREWGRDLVRQAGLTPTTDREVARDDVVDALDDLGFSAERPSPDVVRLRRCPLLEAAHRHTDVVCGVHLGMVQGAMTELGVPSDGVVLQPFAERGACRLLFDAPAGA